MTPESHLGQGPQPGRSSPPPWACAALSLAAGLGVALVLHYVLYRISIPGTPFIYAVF